MGLQERILELRELSQRKGVVELFVAAAAFLAFVSSLAFSFVYDDRMTVDALGGPHAWRRMYEDFIIRSHPDGGAWIVHYYYRPMTIASERFLLMLGGESAMPYHLATAILHAVAATLFYRVAKRLWGAGAVAIAAAFFFALHPIHVQAVVWCSAISDLLVGLFLFAALAAGLRWLESQKAIWLTLSLLAGAAGLLSKETAVVLPIILLAVAWAHPQSREFGRRIGWLVGSHVALAFCYLGLRSYMIAPQGQVSTSLVATPAVVGQAPPVWLGWPEAGVFYLRQLFALASISPVYPLDHVMRADATHFYQPLGVLALVAIPVGYLFWRAEQRRRLLACFVWVLAPLSLVLIAQTHLLNGQLVAERYLYTASGGFCLLLAAALSWLAAKLPVGENKGCGVAATLTVVALLMGGSTVVNQQYWASDLLLFRHAIDVCPDDPTAMMNLGASLCDRKQYDAGRYVYSRVLSRTPYRGKAWFNYGLSLYMQNKYADSEPYFIRAVELTSPPDGNTWAHLVGAQVKLGKIDVASKNLTLALQLLPKDPQLVELRGFIALERKQPEEARQAFLEAIPLLGENADVRRGLQIADQMMKSQR